MINMNGLKKMIGTIWKKNCVKLLLLVFVMFTFLWWNTFASDGNITDKIWAFFHYIVAFLSWWWILLANLAWKFMTNSLIYWEFINFDRILWTLWNIVKNFANFALWFMFLFSVVRNLISPIKESDKKWQPFEVIKKSLIAWILIQMSRFLLAAVIDISTICIAAVWSFPAQIISSNTDVQVRLQSIVKWNQKIIFDTTSTWPDIVTFEQNPIESDDDVLEILDTLLPSSDSVSGPLIYLWMSVFDFDDLSNLKNIENNWDTNWLDDWKWLLLQLSFSVFLLFSYTIMVFFIFLFSFFRLIMLWIIIPLLPIIIILKVFWSDKIDLGSLSGIVKIENIFKLIFKPVLLVWCLSLILLIMTLVKTIIWTQHFVDFSGDGDVVMTSTNNNNWENTTYNSNLNVNWLLDVSMNNFKTSISDILVYIIWLCLIFFLMKMTVESGTWIDFVDKKIKWVSNWLWWDDWYLWKLPIVPIAWWVWIHTLKNTFDRAGDKILTNKLGIDITKQQNDIRNLFGIDDSFNSLESYAKNHLREKWISEAVSIWKRRNLQYNSFHELMEKQYETWNTYNPNNQMKWDEIKAAWNWNEKETSSNNTSSNQAEADGSSSWESPS